MLHTCMHSSHNDSVITSDNTAQNTGTLLCLKQYLSLLRVRCITTLTVAAERSAHERVGIRTVRGKRNWSVKIMALYRVISTYWSRSET